MTEFRVGDRVIVNIDGHDGEWTVRHIFVDRLILERDQISVNLPQEMVRPVSMKEPTRFKARFKPGDPVIVTIDGHDVRATLDHHGDNNTVWVKFYTGGRGEFWNWEICPVTMEEPDKFGAMVQTDDGPAVRHTENQMAGYPWIMDGSSYPCVYRTFEWSQLMNTRPYTGGD